MFYSVRETWSHVIEMLRRYWLEVRFVFVYNILLLVVIVCCFFVAYGVVS